MMSRDVFRLNKLMSKPDRDLREEKELAGLFKDLVREEYDITIEHIISELDYDEDDEYNAGGELCEQCVNLYEMFIKANMTKRFYQEVSDFMMHEHEDAINYLISYWRVKEDELDED